MGAAGWGRPMVAGQESQLELLRSRGSTETPGTSMAHPVTEVQLVRSLSLGGEGQGGRWAIAAGANEIQSGQRF